VIENGVKFSFDMCDVMFCSGNNTERMRMGKLRLPGETVVDFYAGIGYYTVPLLVHAQVQRLYACEWNPQSLLALRHNLAEAGVADRCQLFEGDNQITSSSLVNVADRVLLGLLPSSRAGWRLAARALKATGGVIHVHENVHERDLSQWLEILVAEFGALFRAERKDFCTTISHVERVKSYAPRVNHYVIDLVCTLSAPKA
jgi:tRNA G37 N-methylase Trm5